MLLERFLSPVLTAFIVALRRLAAALPWIAVMALAGATVWLWGSELLRLAGTNAPAATLDAIVVTPAAQDIYLGRVRLLQNEGPTSADEPHVRLRQINGRWDISNVSSRRRLTLAYSDGAEYNADRRLLRDGDAVTLTPIPGPGRIVIGLPAGDPDRIDLAIHSDAARTPRTPPRAVSIRHARGGARLSDPAGGAAIARACPGTGGDEDDSDGLLNAARRFVQHGRERTLVRFGGVERDCVRNGVAYVALPGRPMGLIEIRHIPKRGFALVPGLDAGARFARPGEAEVRLADIRHPLAPTDAAGHALTTPQGAPVRLTRITVGRSAYQFDWPSQDEARTLAFTIKPHQGTHRIAAPEDGASVCPDVQSEAGSWRIRCADAPRTADAWRQFWPKFRKDGPAFAWIGGLFVGVLITAYVAVRVSAGRTIGDLPRALCAALAVTAAFVAFRHADFVAPSSATPLAPWPALLAWSAGMANVMLLARGRSLGGAMVMIVATALVATGHVALAAMAFSTDNLYFAAYYNDTTRRAIPIGGAMLALSALVSPAGIVAIARSFVARTGRFPLPLGLILTILAIAALVAAWLLFGSQTGIAGVVQPSEIIKVLFVLVLASAAAQALDIERGAYRSDATKAAWVIAGMLVVFIVAVFVVPIVRSDHSPFFIMANTMLVGVFIVSAFHRVALATQRLSATSQGLPPGHRPPPRPLTALNAYERVAVRLARIAKGCFGYVKTRPFEAVGFILAPFAAGAAIYLVGWMLSDPVSWRESLMDGLGGRFNTPAERFLSFIELNGQPPAGEQSLSVEFPDVGLQVIRSRAIIEASQCRLSAPAAPLGLAERAPAFAQAWARAAIDGVNATLRQASGALRGSVCAAAAPAIAAAVRPRDVERLRLPEVQNDFMSTWLFVAIGRDGALFVALLQCMLASTLLLAAFSVCRWFPGDEPNRAPGTFMAYACIGLTATLALQWAISWLNAFGKLPVMGQPSTFLSHGVSHMLGFGIPTLIVALSALRMRLALKPPRRTRLPDISFLDGPLARALSPRILAWLR